MNKNITAWLFLPLILLSGCAVNISDYKTTKSSFLLEDYFEGFVVANGMIQDYTGKVTRRFCVDINGTWENGLLTLDEDFYYADGETDYRQWQITKTKDGYQGSANDIAGMAYGSIEGFAFRWQYDFELMRDGKPLKLAVDDWMYLLNSTELMNRSKLKKFGVTVGEITLFFKKNGQSCQS